VSIKQVPDTQMIEIRVEHNDPEEVAVIANTMVTVLMEENAAMQSGQYLALEASLSSQLEQVKRQIATAEAQYDQASEKDYQNQLSQVDEQIIAIQNELSTLQTEIAQLSKVATVEGRAQLAEKGLRVAQLQSNIKIYEDLRANLLVLKKPVQTGRTDDNPGLQQLRSTINLYQELYIDLLSKLESTRLAHLQQTTNAVQIEAAFAPSTPVRPIPTIYALLSGAVGLALAGAVVALLEVLGEDLGLPKTSVARKHGKLWKSGVSFE
jgi:tyrosine-protein kinase Etk/Wzc